MSALEKNRTLLLV